LQQIQVKPEPVDPVSNGVSSPDASALSPRSQHDDASSDRDCDALQANDEEDEDDDDVDDDVGNHAESPHNSQKSKHGDLDVANNSDSHNSAN
jgi:hypothetical protein